MKKRATIEQCVARIGEAEMWVRATATGGEDNMCRYVILGLRVSRADWLAYVSTVPRAAD